MDELSCFTAYDVRGRVPDQFNGDIARRIGRAYASVIKPRSVVIGQDVRLSSEMIKDALIEGLQSSGVNVYDIGLAGSEEIYFATSYADMDGGIIITASHNPRDYNGMKFVRESSKPVSRDTGLLDIKALAEENCFLPAPVPGRSHKLDISRAYVKHLLGFVDPGKLKPLKILANAGNGGAGRVLDLLSPHLPFELIYLHHEPDGNFPNGVPNPLVGENRKVTADALLNAGADMAVAWDGDFDRCFFFDECGVFIEGYYVVGLLAEAFLREHPGEKIIHDPRLTWNTIDITRKWGGQAIQCKSGHAFIKECMRRENAIYGGEMSAHHYFRDFFYCDSGMIPWLLVAQLMSRRSQPLSALVAERVAKYPCSGEINRTISDPAAAIAKVREHYESHAPDLDYTDGLSMEFDHWRMNLRMSNTEPVVRLNVEAAGDRRLMEEKTAELLSLLDSLDTQESKNTLPDRKKSTVEPS